MFSFLARASRAPGVPVCLVHGDVNSTPNVGRDLFLGDFYAIEARSFSQLLRTPPGNPASVDSIEHSEFYGAQERSGW